MFEQNTVTIAMIFTFAIVIAGTIGMYKRRAENSMNPDNVSVLMEGESSPCIHPEATKKQCWLTSRGVVLSTGMGVVGVGVAQSEVTAVKQWLKPLDRTEAPSPQSVYHADSQTSRYQSPMPRKTPSSCCPPRQTQP